MDTSLQLEHTPSFISPQLSPKELHIEKTLKLGVLASGSGTNFEVIAQAINHQELNAKIPLLIYNNPQAKVAERAQRLNLEAKLLNHRKFKRREDLDQAIVNLFKEYEIDWVIMAGWMRIVTPVLLEAFPNHVINIHPSLLPSFKGINAVEQALESGVKITGCTVHLASIEVDSGPILLQAAVPILPHDTPETLQARIQIQEHKILPQGIALAAQLYP
ncbi:phosphoribosylglycinamide formyltransferase [Crocosphaera sp. XPORK-15E]|uniref:phosphoribosylglycinamide formyltransferase n=1 Tax=Crocosphaera sp. XPORK-15E TaxID=3110247 RepID=UPI002B20DCC3|nr:phosphoribosylglycinamide formyltransferase [Crocosphaera sp. XPORK-15E]MEA5536543.1 phosphoribosylglycinamide formyltransferase [Crocosphaera sp. XPORK-15E]